MSPVSRSVYSVYSVFTVSTPFRVHKRTRSLTEPKRSANGNGKWRVVWQNGTPIGTNRVLWSTAVFFRQSFRIVALLLSPTVGPRRLQLLCGGLAWSACLHVCTNTVKEKYYSMGEDVQFVRVQYKVPPQNPTYQADGSTTTKPGWCIVLFGYNSSATEVDTIFLPFLRKGHAYNMYILCPCDPLLHTYLSLLSLYLVPFCTIPLHLAVYLLTHTKCHQRQNLLHVWSMTFKRINTY